MYIVTDKFTSCQGYQKCYLYKKIFRNLFLRLKEFGNICGTNFCDFYEKILIYPVASENFKTLDKTLVRTFSLNSTMHFCS